MGMSQGYRAWVEAATVSQVGDGALYVALGWSASGYGGAATGLVLAAITVPGTVLLLVGGVVADRLGPRTVLLAADVVLLTASLVATVGTLCVNAASFVVVLGGCWCCVPHTSSPGRARRCSPRCATR